jgi:hypothetical protein
VSRVISLFVLFIMEAGGEQEQSSSHERDLNRFIYVVTLTCG